MAKNDLIQPTRVNWPSARKVFWSSKTLTYGQRMSIWRQGREDAQQGLVRLDSEGNLTSAWCINLIHAANRCISEEWGICADRTFQFKAYLDQGLHRLSVLQDELTDLIARRERDFELVREMNLTADDSVTRHMAIKRRVRREQELHMRYDASLAELRDAITNQQLDLIPVHEDYRNAEDIASAHEYAIRQDYQSRLAMYAYGASKYMELTEDVVNESGLTDEPRRKHAELFHTYEDAVNQATANLSPQDGEE